MKIAYTEKYYKDVLEDEHFWSDPEDCGWILVEKIKTESGWEWYDGNAVIHRIDPEAIVWVRVQFWGWWEYLIRILTTILILLVIAFFCYAVVKG